MGSRFADLDRPPLDARALRKALVGKGSGLWRELRVLESTTSTNTEVAEAARSGAAQGIIVFAEEQTAGRGRLGRQWTQPVRAGIAVSVLLRPDSVPQSRWGWLPLLAGVATARSIAEASKLPVRLKWPNDVLLGEESGTAFGKMGGILAEVVDGAVVVGIGLNVTTRQAELPPSIDAAAYPATSLGLRDAQVTDRSVLLRSVLRALETDYTIWSRHHGDPESSGLYAAYGDLCETVGKNVTVRLPMGDVLAGEATGIDLDGRLVLTTQDGQRHVAAGDVLHVR